MKSKDLTEAPLGIIFIIKYGLAGSLKVLEAQVLGTLVIRFDNCSSKGVRNHRDFHLRKFASEAIYNLLIGLMCWLVLLKLYLEYFDFVCSLHGHNFQVKPEPTGP